MFKHNKKIKFASKNTLAGTRKKTRAPYLKRYVFHALRYRE